MRFHLLYATVMLALLSLPSFAQEYKLTKRLEFNQVKQDKNVVGVVEGTDSKQYTIKVKKNQNLMVEMNSEGVFFNIYSPHKHRDDDALFVGKSQGKTFEGRLVKDGLYVIKVYLNTKEAEEEIRRIFEMHVKLI